MATAPLIHKNLPLAARAEVALSGFLSVDLFRMLAEQKVTELQLPRGSLFMASQTCFNIQGVALSTVLIAISKTPDFQPWTYGHARLSELPVEEWFSYLRNQSNNSQLTRRGYFQAGCRQQIKRGKHFKTQNPVSRAGEPPLTEQEFLSYLKIL